jgi:C-terminal processing protease CtpA/Prc/Tol biopolymer transport system component
MKNGISLLLICFGFTVCAQPLVLQPSINPEGDVIAFTYQGDIWTVSTDGGRADRITIHEGYDSRPTWSRDGSQIAFSSDRYGNNDVFLVNATGGVPERMTYHSGNDLVLSMTSSGSVLFNTRRIYAQVEREWEIYEAKPDGGTPSRFMDALGFDAVVSPDGNKIAFVRGTCRTAREAYRGPANRDVWIYNITEDSYQQLTDFEGNDFSPQWLDDSTILYITSQSGKYNIHQAGLNGENQPLTSETDFGVNSFSLSGRAGKLVYQYGNSVALFDLNSGEKSIPGIDVNSDYRFDPEVAKSVSNKVNEFAVSPDGKLSAYIHRGEVFVTRNDKEDARSVKLTNGPARERDVVWLNDDIVLCVSDRNGQNDIFMIRSRDANEENIFQSLKHEILPVTNTMDEEEFDPIVSPDGKKIAYRQGRGRLLVADISTQGVLSNTIVLQDGWDTPGGVSWSPDSKWLAYSLSDLNFNEEVYIHAADDSMEPVNISMHPKYDGSPVWSPDGSKLGFISQRNNSDFDVWFAWLQVEDWERSKEEWKRSEFTEEEDEDDEENGVEVKIDFDRIYQRLEQVTSFSGNESGFAFDKEGEFVYYGLGSPGRQNYKVERNLYKIKWDGSEKEEVIGGDKQPASLRLNAKGDYLYLLTKGGKITRVKTKDDKDETLSVTSKFNIRYGEERSQIFEEGWRALNAGFYDPQFHGQDWDTLKAKYQPIALSASTKEDFQYIFNLMLGQLNASHMGMYRGENQKETQNQKTGILGIEGVQTSDGFKISRVLPGSPAARVESQLNIGDVIRSVNNQEVASTTNIYQHLIGQADNPTLLGVQRANNAMEEVVIWPVSSLSSELYDDWVEARRSLVEEYSNGRLGYLHIRGMNWTSFERFERELMAAGYGKDGIVIDVRYNGGGWTTDYLMTVLNVRQHAYTIPSGAAANLQEEHPRFANTYPFGERLPLASWTKPSIALCNENSYSNAEIFSHAYKTLDLGTLVGQPTFGAVISTGGWGLVDGSFVRMPFRAWYVKATAENMENGPAVPDILVENPPPYKSQKVDPQLKRAVDELLSQLDN